MGDLGLVDVVCVNQDVNQSKGNIRLQQIKKGLFQISPFCLFTFDSFSLSEERRI